MQINEQRVIDELQRDLDEIERHSPMSDNYARITPEISEHEQAGHRFKFIAFHYESREWFGSGRPEWGLVKCKAASLLRPDDIVFDLGCNAGYLTVWFAMECPIGHVHAFDPFPWNAAATRAQAKLNGLSNVTAHAVGLGASTRKLTAVVTSSKTFNHDASSGEGATVVLDVRSPQEFEKLRPTFLKIDIEGAEHELSQTDILSWASVDRGYIEMHPQFISAGNADPRSFLNRLGKEGYKVSFAHPDAAHITPEEAHEVKAADYYFRRMPIRATKVA